MALFLQKRYAMPLLLGGGAILTALTLVFPQVGFLEWATMVPMIAGAFLLCGREGVRLRKCYLYGFFTVFCYYFVLYHWFVRLYPLDFVGLDNASSLAVIVAGWLGLSLLQAIPGGLIFLFFRLIHRTGVFDRAPMLRPFVFAALWVIFEWTSTLCWAGVPWGRLCLGQIELLPMVQLSSAFGSYAVSFLLLAVNGLVAFALLYPRREVLCGGLAVGLVIGNLVFGAIAMSLPAEEGETVTAAVIQGNINSHEKWDGNSEDRMRQVYADLTRQAAAEGAELVVWPETALPYVLNTSRSLQNFVSGLAQECGVTLIVGALYADDSGEYNSLYLVHPDGSIAEQHYDKRHLVPFGEYVPMRELIMTLIPPLANLSALDDDLTPGSGSALFSTEWGEIGSLICFDSIYEMLGLESVRDGAGLMIISSNDSWFYDSAAVYQHQAQAQLRAIEEGRYLLRAANTGISTVLDPNGRILRWIDPLEEGYAVCEVSFRTGRTLYSIIGNLFVYLCIALCTAAPVAGVVLRKRANRQNAKT